jgi:hypothetical protein
MMARFARVGLDRLDHRLQRLAAHLDTAGKPRAVTSGEDGAAAGDVAGAGANGASVEEAPSSAAGPLGGSPPYARGDGGPATPGTDDAALPGADAPTIALAAVAAPRIVAAAHEAMERPIPAEVGTPAAAEALHEVRIAAKKLRYLLEIVAPDLGDAGARLVKRLKGLQDHLGDFHDDTVLDETLSRAIARAADRGRRRMASELRRFRALRRRALVRDERAVRAALGALRERGFAAEIADALIAAGVPAARLQASDAASGRRSDRCEQTAVAIPDAPRRRNLRRARPAERGS